MSVDPLAVLLVRYATDRAEAAEEVERMAKQRREARAAVYSIYRAQENVGAPERLEERIALNTALDNFVAPALTRVIDLDAAASALVAAGPPYDVHSAAQRAAIAAGEAEVASRRAALTQARQACVELPISSATGWREEEDRADDARMALAEAQERLRTLCAAAPYPWYPFEQ